MNSRETLVMVRRCTISLVILASALAAFATGPARADACAQPALDVDAGLAQKWPELAARVRTALEQPNLDRCARVRLNVRANAIAVIVELADGRVAERTVTQASDVVPTLAALLVLPQPPERAQASDSDTPPSASKPPATPSAPATPDPADGPPIVVRSALMQASPPDTGGASKQALSKHIRVELSAVTGARVGDGQVSAGAGVLSLLEISGWLAGFAGRADQYHALGPGDSSSSALELALLAGWRFRTGNTAFDLILGPAAVFQGTTTFEAQGPLGRTITESSSSTAPRLLLGARATLFARSPLRPFVGLDGELGPGRAEGTSIPNAPELPRWTIGLSAGLTVGT